MFFLEVNPSVVRPGWTPLIITILLGAAIAVLMWSMRRQMRKIQVPRRDELGDAEQGGQAPAPENPKPSEPSDTDEPGSTGNEADQADDRGTTGNRDPISHS